MVKIGALSNVYQPNTEEMALAYPVNIHADLALTLAHAPHVQQTQQTKLIYSMETVLATVLTRCIQIY